MSMVRSAAVDHYDPLMSVWPDIAAERVNVADLVEGLDAAQLATPSLCGEWTVHEVAAHLLMPLVTSKGDIARAMVRARGNFHRANAALARRTAQRPATEIAALLRTRSGSHFRPPLHPPVTPLTDLLIHGQDIRRPLGLTRRFEPHRLRAALDFLTSKRAYPGFVARGRLAGLRLRATDLDWTYGDGAEVSATGEALLLAMAGRSVVLPELDGPGAQVLRSR
jgi:uncharacterized protein (TIGR03083 family)